MVFWGVCFSMLKNGISCPLSGLFSSIVVFRCFFSLSWRFLSIKVDFQPIKEFWWNMFFFSRDGICYLPQNTLIIITNVYSYCLLAIQKIAMRQAYLRNHASRHQPPSFRKCFSSTSLCCFDGKQLIVMVFMYSISRGLSFLSPQNEGSREIAVNMSTNLAFSLWILQLATFCAESCASYTLCHSDMSKSKGNINGNPTSPIESKSLFHLLLPFKFIDTVKTLKWNIFIVERGPSALTSMLWKHLCCKHTKYWLSSGGWKPILLRFFFGIPDYRTMEYLRSIFFFSPTVLLTMSDSCKDCIDFWRQSQENSYTPQKFNSSPLKNGGWRTSYLLGFGNFSNCELLDFGGVSPDSWVGSLAMSYSLPSHGLGPWLQLPKAQTPPKKTIFQRKTSEKSQDFRWYCWWFRNPAFTTWDV